MIFVLDNYDSFTYNLVHLLYASGQEVRVARNRDIKPDAVLALEPDAIVLSPGPGESTTASGLSASTASGAMSRLRATRTSCPEACRRCTRL